MPAPLLLMISHIPTTKPHHRPTQQSYEASSSLPRCPILRLPTLQAMQCQSIRPWPDLCAARADILQIHHALPSIPTVLSTSCLGIRARARMRTSGYLEQILNTASRTSSCSCVKPDVSIMLRDGVIEKHLECGSAFNNIRGV